MLTLIPMRVRSGITIIAPVSKGSLSSHAWSQPSPPQGHLRQGCLHMSLPTGCEGLTSSYMPIVGDGTSSSVDTCPHTHETIHAHMRPSMHTDDDDDENSSSEKDSDTDVFHCT